MNSESYSLAQKLLGSKVKIKIDRPRGSKHPKWGFEYGVNYGYVEGVIAPDGEELDVYLMGVSEAVDEYEGVAIAIVHRTENDDDKLVIAPEGMNFSDEEIEKAVEFQEKWFKHEIKRD